MHHNLWKADDDADHHDLDNHEWHRAPVDLPRRHPCGADAGDFVDVARLGGHRPQVEQRETKGRVHERGLHVHPEDHAEPDQINSQGLRRSNQQGDDDEREFEEIEEERQQEHQDRHKDQEPGLSARHADQKMLDPDLSIHPVEGERKDPRADQDEHDERRQPGGGFQRLPDHAHVQTTLQRRQQQRPDRPHGPAFRRRCDAKEDRAQHQKDQRQWRDQHHDHLLRKAGHGVHPRRLVDHGVKIDHRNPDGAAKDISIGPMCRIQHHMGGVADADGCCDGRQQGGDAMPKRPRL